jgi:hypothetical protein
MTRPGVGHAHSACPGALPASAGVWAPAHPGSLVLNAGRGRSPAALGALLRGQHACGHPPRKPPAPCRGPSQPPRLRIGGRGSRPRQCARTAATPSTSGRSWSPRGVRPTEIPCLVVHWLAPDIQTLGAASSRPHHHRAGGPRRQRLVGQRMHTRAHHAAPGDAWCLAGAESRRDVCAAPGAGKVRSLQSAPQWGPAWRRPSSHPQPAAVIWLWVHRPAAGCRLCRQGRCLSEHVARRYYREQKDCHPC